MLGSMTDEASEAWEREWTSPVLRLRRESRREYRLLSTSRLRLLLRLEVVLMELWE